jgi:hypothetical protein
MASDSFARGGSARSVPDPDKEAYEEMIRRRRALQSNRETSSSAAGTTGPQQRPRAPSGPVDYVAAGIAGILNGPREARREVEQGHPIKGVAHAATAAADLELGRSIVNGVRRGAFKVSGSHSWGATRKWMGKKGLAEDGQHVHHWAIPNGRWGKRVPDFIKNQPWNGRPMETPLHHIRTHGASRKFGLPQFNVFERYWHATPGWWKAANASLAGHAIEAVEHGGEHNTKPLASRHQAEPGKARAQVRH